MRMELRRKEPSNTFGNRQEDYTECLAYFLDSINDQKLNQLFEHKYTLTLWCDSCKKEGYDIENNLPTQWFHVNVATDLTKYILQHSYRDSDHNMDREALSIAPKCDCGDYMHTVKRLVYAPEILVVSFDKKTMANFPPKLSLPSTGKNLNYILISKVNHSGSERSGHYWTHCLRKQQNKLSMFNLNDTMVSDGNNTPEASTYIAMYHLM